MATDAENYTVNLRLHLYFLLGATKLKQEKLFEDVLSDVYRKQGQGNLVNIHFLAVLKYCFQVVTLRACDYIKHGI